MHWYDELREIESRGSQADRPGSLAGLVAARKIHLGQFFTPDAVAELMWKIAYPAMQTVEQGQPITLFDNSVGSGRLLQFATPGRHSIYGVDIDATVLMALGKAAQNAGFICEFNDCGMEAARPSHFHVALINPPFSLHLESPLLKPYPSTAYGKYGPNTSALSHSYALAQAVSASQITVALLPSSFAEELCTRPADYLEEDDVKRLRAHISLPAGTFKEEGTDVRVSLVVFDSAESKFEKISLKSITDTPLNLNLRLGTLTGTPKLKVLGVTDDEPAITLPVTGNSEVRVAHNSRKIILKFSCGLTQARVLNAIYRNRISDDEPAEYRRPKGFLYAGQGALDMEVHLAQERPEASFKTLIERIEKASGTPVVHPGVWAYLRRRIRQTELQRTPMRHSIYIPEGTAGEDSTVTGKARKTKVADPKKWGSPVIKKGQEITFHRQADGTYAYSLMGNPYAISPGELYEEFDITKGAAQKGWTLVHPGLVETFPHIAQSLQARAKTLGIDKWLTWGFQWHDLIETTMKPQGCIVAWTMGLGKARLGSALILLSDTKHGLITVEAGLMDEMRIELESLPIEKDNWQIITSPTQLQDLRKINIIAYERLRMPADNTKPRITYASKLRRRIGILIADEGDLLSNPTSQQSRALHQVSPRKKYVLTATPCANYPRDLLPIMAYSSGDSTAAQPWGWRGSYLEVNHINSVSYAKRGIEAFREQFVTTAWVTKEFEQTLIEGAKREIPKINNLRQYRTMLAPHIKRRLTTEPDVAKYIKIPKENRKTVTVPWDSAHLAHYLRVAEEFSNWYMKQKEDTHKNTNLIAILARINAVTFASNYPQHHLDGFGSYGSLTSKQRWVLDELERLTKQGRKTILYAENPGQVEMLGRHLSNRGIDSVTFHGKRPVSVRTKELNERFRHGDCPVLLATLGVTQKGLNLWQANEVILISRSWSATVEEQAIGRTLRPQQKDNVNVQYVHLPGGIDVYMEQMVEFKKDSAEAGIDWATPTKSDVDFLHLDTLLDRFVTDLAKFKNIDRRDVRKHLEQEALYA